MSVKTATKPTPTAPIRKTASKPSASSGKGSGSLTHEVVAGDIAAFRKAGGQIEVLGHTPFRPASASRSSAKAPTPVAGATASKTTG